MGKYDIFSWINELDFDYLQKSYKQLNFWEVFRFESNPLSDYQK